MTAEQNPFKAPDARVDDLQVGMGEFIAGGQRVPAGHGAAWISQGWELFRRAPGTWIGITIVFVVMIILLSLVPLVNVLVNLFIPVFIGGLMLGCKSLDEGGELRFGHLFAGFSGYTGNLVLVGVIYLVGIIAIAIIVALLVGVGSFGMAAGSMKAGGSAMVLAVLVGVALMAPLAAAVWYAPALVVLHEVPPFQAMKSSFSACLRNFFPFLIYGLLMMVLALLASLPLMLGWLVLTPALYGSFYAGYKDIFTRA